jgi:hypothetical protein
MAQNRARIIATLLTALAVVGLASAQEVEPLKPKPPVSRSPDKPAVKHPKPAPSASASASASPPLPSASTSVVVLPTPDEACRTAGGDWRDGRCSMDQKVCIDAGNTWNRQALRCEPRCPPGMKPEGSGCLTTQPNPPPPPPPPPACPAGTLWDGQTCSAACPHGHRYDPARGCVAVSPAPSASATPPPAAATGIGPWRTIAFIGSGVLIAAGAVTGIWALKKKSSMQEQCVSHQCYASARDDYDTGKVLGNISTGTFIGGGVLLVAAFLLPSGRASASPNSPTIGASAGPAGGHLVLQGSF